MGYYCFLISLLLVCWVSWWVIPASLFNSGMLSLLVSSCRGIGIFVNRWVTLSPPTIFVEKLYKILKILDKSNCIVNFRSMSKRIAQQTARKAVSKRLGRRFKNCEGKGIFLKNGHFWKMFGQIYTLRLWARNGPWSKNSILKLSKAFLLSSVLLFLSFLWGPQFGHSDDFLNWLKFFLEN